MDDLRRMMRSSNGNPGGYPAGTITPSSRLEDHRKGAREAREIGHDLEYAANDTFGPAAKRRLTGCAMAYRDPGQALTAPQ